MQPVRKQKWIAREERRKRALRWIRAVHDQFHGVQSNIENGAHITIWFSPYVRVEWWPGTMKYRYRGETHRYSHLDDFIGWITRERTRHVPDVHE